MAKRYVGRSAVEAFELRWLRVPEGARALIVGSRIYGGKEDRRLRYPGAIGVDALDGPGVDVVQDMEEDSTALGVFDHIECLSVMEHSRRPWLLAQSITRALRVGGTLYLSVPFVWREHNYPGDYWRFTAQAVPLLFPAIRWSALWYASNDLRPDGRLRAIEHEAHPYMPRCEVVAFGERVS